MRFVYYLIEQIPHLNILELLWPWLPLSYLGHYKQMPRSKDAFLLRIYLMFEWIQQRQP